jgi:small subunit ribosomal protein S15
MPAVAVPVLSLKFSVPRGTRPGKVDDSIKRGYEQSMPLTTTRKQELINTHQTHGTDTGSVEVQVAMLSDRINQLSGHLQKNIHDFSSRQGLLKMIGRRKRLLSYLRQQNDKRYAALVEKLGIRG